jgi:hypothetical protein
MMKLVFSAEAGKQTFSEEKDRCTNMVLKP